MKGLRGLSMAELSLLEYGTELMCSDDFLPEDRKSRREVSHRNRQMIAYQMEEQEVRDDII